MKKYQKKESAHIHPHHSNPTPPPQVHGGNPSSARWNSGSRLGFSSSFSFSFLFFFGFYFWVWCCLWDWWKRKTRGGVVGDTYCDERNWGGDGESRERGVLVVVGGGRMEKVGLKLKKCSRWGAGLDEIINIGSMYYVLLW